MRCALQRFLAQSEHSEKIGDIPFKLYARSTKETVRDHPAYKLIHDEANPYTSASQLRVNLTKDACFTMAVMHS